MNHKRLINALTKVGATISNPNPSNLKWFRAVGKNGGVVVWYAQAAWNNPEELKAVSVHTPDPRTDAMTDLFMDYHHSSIKSAVKELSG